MIVFTFVSVCLVFFVALGCIIFWSFFEDAEDFFYRSLLFLIVMAIIPILLPIWSDKVFPATTIKWVTIISSIVVIASVITYIWRYIFDSINYFELRLMPFIIPVLIASFVIGYTVSPELVISNLTNIIACIMGLVGVIAAIISFCTYRRKEKELKYRMGNLRHSYIDNSPIAFLNEEELLKAEKVVIDLYMETKDKRLSRLHAMDILIDSELSNDLKYKIMDRLLSDDFIERCSLLTLTDFIQELLPELYGNKRSYRSYSMDMRYFEDFYNKISYSLNAQNNRVIDELNKKLDLVNNHIRKNLITNIESLASDEDYGRQNQIRELFHALETPIATSEMALSNLKASFNSLTEHQHEKIDRIINAIKLIKSILYAYRELTFMNIYSDENTFFSLPEIIGSIPELMPKGYSSDVLEQRDVPDYIPKYSTNLIVVLLLPLIHNAIEASPDNKSVLIECTNSDIGSMIKIVNYCKHPPRQEDLDTEGYSSKGDNHEGTGISIVRRISKFAGIDFGLKVNNNKVSAILTFPKQ